MTSIEPGRYNATPPRLKDRVALVTGGASGIGRAICLAYANEGAAHVFITDLQPTSKNPDEAEVTTHDLIQKHGGNATFIKTDVTVADSVDAAVGQVVAKCRRLDVMVNCAGVITSNSHIPQPPIWECTTDLWHFVMKINGDGVFHGTRAAAAQMIKQDPLPTGDRGWIINLASIFGLVGVPEASPYVASKHLVMGVTKSASLDLAPKMIHCNAINPGYVASNMTNPHIADPNIRGVVESMHPLRGIGIPEHVSRVAVFLASDDARWITGQGIVCDGGYTTQ